MESLLNHEVHRISVLDAIFLQKFIVCEDFAFKEKTLNVDRRCSRYRSKLRLDGRDGVCGLYLESVRLRRLEGFEGDVDQS